MCSGYHIAASQITLWGHSRNTIVAKGSLSEGLSHKPVVWFMIEREKDLHYFSFYILAMSNFLIIEEFSVPSGKTLNLFGITESRNCFANISGNSGCQVLSSDRLMGCMSSQWCTTVTLFKCIDDSLPVTHIRWA